MTFIRVFLVEDHELFASGVRTELGREFEIVGHAATVREAIEAIPRAAPDVVLLDVHLPDGGARASWRRSRHTNRTCASSRCRCPTPPRTSSP